MSCCDQLPNASSKSVFKTEYFQREYQSNFDDDSLALRFMFDLGARMITQAINSKSKLGDIHDNIVLPPLPQISTPLTIHAQQRLSASSSFPTQ